MPQPALHLTLADHSLYRWQQSPAAAPFDICDPAVRTAFLLGALAPDMGYFPGGSSTRLLSVAVHAGGGTDLARTMLGRGSDLIQAFAWGWMHHVLADVRIHPLVNLGGGALLRDAGIHDPDDGLRMVAHIRVELGLEGRFSRKRRVPPAVLREVLDDNDLQPLAAAIRTALHLDLDTTQLRTAQRAIVNCSPFCEQLAAVLATDLRRGRAHRNTDDFLRLPGVRRVASSLLARTSLLVGFLNPVCPPDWLMQSVQAEVAGFPASFEQLVAAGLDGVPNFDLDTGSLAEPRTSAQDTAHAA